MGAERVVGTVNDGDSRVVVVVGEKKKGGESSWGEWK